jgi:hypothetical protein
MCNVSVTGNGFMSQVAQERRLDGIGKVDSLTGAGCLPEVNDKFEIGGDGDSIKLSHPAPDLAGTVSPGERAVVAMHSSCSVTEKETSSITTADSSSKNVSFGLILVREYDRVVGDNPTVRVGPPMSIGWEFVQKQGVPVDIYEKIKRPRRPTSDLRMCSLTRKSILRYEFGVSLEDIRAAEKIARKIQRQRFQTANQGETVAAIECAIESAKRKMHRIFSNKPP